MRSKITRVFCGLAALAMPFVFAGCSSTGSGPGGTTPPGVEMGTVVTTISDASSEDWAIIGVKVLSISLTPQGGGSDVTVYTAPSPAPYVNLVQLDQLSEILGNATIPAGTYTAATLTVGGNPGDVLLTAATDPEAGFAGTAGAAVASSQIQIRGTSGSAGSLTVPVKVNLDSPLVVTANQTNALDLEFDLAHPAFIVGHVPPAGNGSVVWAVNFKGPVRRHRVARIDALLLRHHYGTVGSVSSDNTSITVTKDYPVEPPTTPETAVTTTQAFTILADSTNGTIFYDVDAKTHTTITDFSSVAASLVGKFVRVAARYQENGTLVGVRIWASSSFNSVWLSPEGHVLHVNTTSNVLTVQNELGLGVPLTVDANTEFFFRTPANAQGDATPIGTGTAFLANLVRGFKVHASVVDPLASPLVAQTIDIEIARYDGAITGATVNGFTYTRNFHNVNDDYTVTLPFISSTSANGNDPISGMAISGFKWWNFTFPTVVDSGANAVSDFENATNGTITFGGTANSVVPLGTTYATWNAAAAANAWAAPWAILMPTNVPVGLAATAYSNGSFMLMAPGGTNAVTVNLSTTSGSATLVYQIDMTGGVVTINPVDITTSAGQTTLSTNLVANTPVKVFGVPQPDGSIRAYVVFYYTGALPMAGS
jgi:Domain of unknown function (DUF4382)